MLANTLKSKVSELDIRKRIEPTADALLSHEYGKPTLRELAPSRRRAVVVQPGGTKDDPRYKLDILAGSWKNSGVGIKNTSDKDDDDSLRAPKELTAHNAGAWSGDANMGIF